MKKFVFTFMTMMLAVASSMAQDVAAIPDNSIYMMDAQVASGYQTVLSLPMKNSAEVQSFQLQIQFPEGVTVVKNDRGRDMIAMNADRSDGHSFSFRQQKDPTIYKMAALQSGYPVVGNDGEVVNITVEVSKDMPAGDYEIKISDVLLANNKYDKGIISENGEYTGKLTVIEPTGVASVSYADSSKKTIIYNANGMPVSNLQKGINIIKDASTGTVKKVLVE